MSKEKEITFDERVEVIITFIRMLGERDTAKFIAYQEDAIRGLTHNNESFVKAYYKIADARVKFEDEHLADGYIMAIQNVLNTWRSDQHPVMSAEVKQLICEIESALSVHQKSVEIITEMCKDV